MSNQELELETFAGRTIQAWNEAAREAKLVLRQPADDLDCGEYPERIYGQLRRFRKVISKNKGQPKKVVKSMHRQLISTRDELGKECTAPLRQLIRNAVFSL